MTWLGRRPLLGAVAALPFAAVPAIAGDASSDATVIALCAELDRLERQRLTLFYGPARIEDDDDLRDAEQEPIDEAREPVLDRLCATECRTPAGIIAKLCTLALISEALAECPLDEGYDDERLLASALRDALRLRGTDVAAIPGLVEALQPPTAASAAVDRPG